MREMKGKLHQDTIFNTHASARFQKFENTLMV